MIKKKIKKLLAREPDPSYKRRAKIILNSLELDGKEKVLEIGCGRGFYLKTLKKLWPNLKITGVDLNKKYLTEAKKNLAGLKIKLVKGDAQNLPFVDNSFSRIIASEILEHVSNDSKALTEIYRVLKPTGIAIITVPNADYPLLWDPLNWFLEKWFDKHIPSNIWWLAGIWADHQRLYTKKEIENKIKKSGFKIEKTWSTTHYCLPFSHFLFYGIGKNLVEKGLFKSMNRFEEKKESCLRDILLWPIKLIESLNRKENYKTSMNLIFKVGK